MKSSFLVTSTSLLIIDNDNFICCGHVFVVSYCLTTNKPLELQMEANEWPPLERCKAGC